MRKVLVLLVLSTVLLLALSVPAMAMSSEDPSAWGQMFKEANASSDYPLGRDVSTEVHRIKAGEYQWLGIYNFGDLVEFGKSSL